MSNDFDTRPDRAGTFSTKWDKYRDTNILPMWVADMDFRSPEPIVRALVGRAEHGVFGYTQAPEPLVDVVVERMARLYDWRIQPEDVVFLPGVVPGLNMACRGYTTANEAVVTATPVYFPFLDAPGFSGRRLIEVETEFRDNRWHFPLDGLAHVAPESRLLLLCNPHNPVGRALTREELEGIVSIARQHNLLICSDEIHCDLMLDGRRHIPIASLEGAEDITVTLMAASKTFNLAGLGGAMAIIRNPALRKSFQEEGRGILPHINIFAYTSMLAAWRDCAEWHEGLLEYLQANRDLLAREIDNMPGLSLSPVEATYLAWLDVREARLEDAAGFFEGAGVGLSDGKRFRGEGFMRFNFGCPRAMLTEAIERMKRALSDR